MLVAVAGALGWVAWSLAHAPREPDPVPLRVVDEAGRPVAGVPVSVRAPGTVIGGYGITDADGRVTIEIADAPFLGGEPQDGGFEAGTPVLDEGPAARSGWGALRCGPAWYRGVRAVRVTRGATLQLERLEVLVLDPRLGRVDGPRVLANPRLDADDFRTGLAGDDDGLVRVPHGTRPGPAVLVSLGHRPAARSDAVPLERAPDGAAPRVVVLKATHPVARVRLEDAAGAPRPLTRADLTPDPTTGRAPLEVRVWTAAPGTSAWTSEPDLIVDGALGLEDVPGASSLDLTVRLEGVGWARVRGAEASPDRLPLRRSTVTVALTGLRPGDDVSAGAMGPDRFVVRGRRDGDRLRFEDLVPGGWKVTADVRRRGAPLSPSVVAFEVTADGTPLTDVALAVE